jgi:hypothetical protein
MNYIKTLCFSLLLAFPMFVTAQDRTPVTFILVDGSEIEGYVSTILRGAKSFNYSLEPKGQLISMRLEKVKRMITTNGEKNYVYDVIPFLNSKNNKQIELMVLLLLVDGHMRLYHNESDMHYFYLKTHPEAQGVYCVASAVFGTGAMAKKQQQILNKDFKKNGAKFFSDCPEIVEDIEAGNIDTKDMVKLVERYNTYKAGQ